MPSHLSMRLPPPKNWQDFELLVRDAYSARWSSDLQLNGRTGQTQHGVDIYGPDNLGRYIAIQCKCYNKPITSDLIKNELAKTEKFTGNITTLYIATIQEPDQALQAQARIISEERTQKGMSSIALIFWDDIVSALSCNSNVWASHYPSIKMPEQSHSTPDDLHRASLNLGYYGIKVANLFELLFGEINEMTREDRDQFFLALEIIKKQAYLVLNRTQFDPIDHAIKSIYSNFDAQGNLDDVLYLCKRIDMRVSYADNFLPSEDAKFFRVGSLLALIEMTSKPVNPKRAHEAFTLLSCILDETEIEEVRFLFSEEEYKNYFSWPFKVHRALEKLLIFR